MDVTNKPQTPQPGKIPGLNISHETLLEIQRALQPISRAASLPINPPWINYGPYEGYHYMKTSESIPAPVCWPLRSRRPATPLFYRKIATAINTRVANSCIGKQCQKRRKFADGSGIIISTGVGSGEIERPITGSHDWTRDWNWVLSVVLWNADPASTTLMVHCSFFFRDLTQSLQDGVPWRDRDRTERLTDKEFWTTYVLRKPMSMFCHRAIRPMWSGWVVRRHPDQDWLESVDPWDTLARPDLVIHRTELDQRTGAGRFKKVMWYRSGVGYANDLIGEPMTPWHEGLDESVAAFCSRLIPLHVQPLSEMAEKAG